MILRAVDIPRKIEADLRDFVFDLRVTDIEEFFGKYRSVERALKQVAGAGIHFKRVAVTPEQIVSMDLPTRPTKRTDSRAKDFEGESVEVDAILPKTLRQIVSDCITQHIDTQAYNVLMEAEAGERETLQQVAQR